LPVLLVSPSKFALENCYVYCPPQHFDEIFAPAWTWCQSCGKYSPLLHFSSGKSSINDYILQYKVVKQAQKIKTINYKNIVNTLPIKNGHTW